MPLIALWGEPAGTVGIIANPASGKDIRRLVAGATTISNQEKVGILRRLLQGLAAAGVAQVLFMPDERRLARQATGGLAAGNPAGSHVLPRIGLVDMACLGTAADSTRAAVCLREDAAGCIIVLGGDGTARAVSMGAGETPLLALSTGTNNVLPAFTEATIAGLAAGALATGALARAGVPLEAVALRHKWLEVSVDGQAVDRALVDLALLRGRFVGARAVWSDEGLARVIVTRADPATIGLSAIAGVLDPVTPQEPRGLAVTLDPAAARRVLVPLGPGLLVPLGIAAVQSLAVGERLELDIEEPLVVALDGEREFALTAGQHLGVRLRADGPWIVDSSRVMHALVRLRLLERITPHEGETP